MKFRKRIQINRTQGEWEEIIDKIPRNDLNIFLKKEIEKLKKKFRECPKCVTYADGEKICKVNYLDKESYEFLETISEKMKKPISAVVDELIINPILLEQK